MMKNGTWINCGNDFYQDKFVIICERLEEGLLVDVYIDCIGHTRNNMTQEHYKKNLLKNTEID